MPDSGGSSNTFTHPSSDVLHMGMHDSGGPNNAMNVAYSTSAAAAATAAAAAQHTVAAGAPLAPASCQHAVAAGAPMAPASCQPSSMGFPPSYPSSDVGGGCHASGIGSGLAGYPAAEMGTACHTGGACAAPSPMYPEMYPAMMQQQNGAAYPDGAALGAAGMNGMVGQSLHQLPLAAAHAWPPIPQQQQQQQQYHQFLQQSLPQ
mmetsp:Transcript_93779/g.185991  ORF Transcript_93779/g.185991 Transcript_93779/m.185991 type:complete len:205 (+) Transcript_93779:3-617(+)